MPSVFYLGSLGLNLNFSVCLVSGGKRVTLPRRNFAIVFFSTTRVRDRPGPNRPKIILGRAPCVQRKPEPVSVRAAAKLR